MAIDIFPAASLAFALTVTGSSVPRIRHRMASGISAFVAACRKLIALLEIDHTAALPFLTKAMLQY